MPVYNIWLNTARRRRLSFDLAVLFVGKKYHDVAGEIVACAQSHDDWLDYFRIHVTATKSFIEDIQIREMEF